MCVCVNKLRHVIHVVRVITMRIRLHYNIFTNRNFFQYVLVLKRWLSNSTYTHRILTCNTKRLINYFHLLFFQLYLPRQIIDDFIGTNIIDILLI